VAPVPAATTAVPYVPRGNVTANVDNTTFAICCPNKVETHIFPDVSSTSPEGPFNDALIPVPATFDASPFPTRVVTIPAGDIFRTRLFVVSHMYIFPDESKVPSVMPLNNALLNPIDTLP
jgi:hypothetical protein